MQGVALQGKRLKVFKSGNSLAVRIPKSLNLDGIKELIIKKVGKNEITLSVPDQKSEWENFFKTIGKFEGKIERPEQSLPIERDFGFK